MKKRISCFLFLVTILFTKPVHSQSWIELNPPVNNTFNDGIASLATDTAGNIYAVGDFRNSDNEYFVAKWDGRKWLELGAGANALKANNRIICVTTDETGNVYAAGSFTNSTGNTAVAKWNGTSWLEVGALNNALNPNGEIYAMTTDNQGNLYVSGSFTNLSGKHYVAKWNGTTWSELGSGLNALNVNGAIFSVAADKLGNLYAAGNFTNATQKFYVAKWNGAGWTELTGAAPLHANNFINAVKTDNVGNLYAGGAFTNSDGYYYVAKWNGTGWAEVGTGAASLKANGMIKALGISSNGNIYAGGLINVNLGNTPLVEWNGTNWSEIAYLGQDGIRAICLDKKDNVYAAGEFKNKLSYCYVAKWDGSKKSELGHEGDHLHAFNSLHKVVVDSKNQVYATGQSPHLPVEFYIAQWDGKTWKELGGDTAFLHFSDHTNTSFAADLSGNLYVSGYLTDINGDFYIAKWNGHAWSKVVDTANPVQIFDYTTELISDKAGNIYAYGSFGDSKGSQFAIMKWDGKAWKSYEFTNWKPSSLFADTNGTIYAGSAGRDENGNYYVEKIDTSGITRLGAGSNIFQYWDKITALAVDANGKVLASGTRNNGPNSKFVALWNGTSWSNAGSDSIASAVYAMTTDYAGNVYAATTNNNLSSVVKWDGADWTQFGESFGNLIYSVASGLNGNIYVAGLFQNGLGNFFVALYGKKAAWIGGADYFWSNPANWSNGLVPDSVTDVTIDSVVECIINIPSVCRSLIITTGSKLTVNSHLDVLQ